VGDRHPHRAVSQSAPQIWVDRLYELSVVLIELDDVLAAAGLNVVRPYRHVSTSQPVIPDWIGM
jgi:hypothetical protein